jgi:2-hydroxychromene-2-carboxylate isomerase
MLETRRFVARHRLAAFTFNPHFPVNTLVLMRAAVAAAAEGQLAPYVEAVFQHMWERGTKMDDPAVCRAALLESGLDADRLLSRAQDQDVKDTLMRNTQEAVDRGAFGIPTFFVGSEIYFGKDRLRDVEDEITRSSS